jgi:hypothetical protein
MQRYCREVHQWINPRHPGRRREGGSTVDAIGLPWKEGQPCQQIFRSSGWQGYSRVYATIEASSPPRVEDPEKRQAAMHTYLDRLFTDVEIAKQRYSETHVYRSEANV